MHMAGMHGLLAAKVAATFLYEGWLSDARLSCSSLLPASLPSPPGRRPGQALHHVRVLEGLEHRRGILKIPRHWLAGWRLLVEYWLGLSKASS